MGTQKLTERLQTTLAHLKQAKELGSTLSDYAAAFNVNVQELYNGRTQLQRKGLWPKMRKTSARAPQLLAVEVAARNAAMMPAAMNAWLFRISGPGGWVMECRQLPEASWLRELSATLSKVSA
ncbi:MAG: hypothetical protein WDO68_30065 [Gammaproteobacteria bacterium]